MTLDTIAFVGGGNIASALIGGLIAAGQPAASIVVVEPVEAARSRLRSAHDVHVLAAADASLAQASLVVWAVKPQVFREAASSCAGHVAHALQLSVMAGIRSDVIAQATGAERVVRAMPNTPALIGAGIAGLYARDAVTGHERSRIEAVMRPTGEWLWFKDEASLDAVTALSGSGPAYVFYLLETMVDAARAMGLSEVQGRQLAVSTFAGAAELARRSPDSLQQLREQVTSKGGTTHAGIAKLETQGVRGAFIGAIRAAQARARELGDEFGATGS